MIASDGLPVDGELVVDCKLVILPVVIMFVLTLDVFALKLVADKVGEGLSVV